MEVLADNTSKLITALNLSPGENVCPNSLVCNPGRLNWPAGAGRAGALGLRRADALAGADGMEKLQREATAKGTNYD